MRLFNIDLNRNPLHNVRVTNPPPAIVDCRGAGVASQGPHVFERYVLVEQIGDDGDLEAVRGEQIREARASNRRLIIWRMEWGLEYLGLLDA